MWGRVGALCLSSRESDSVGVLRYAWPDHPGQAQGLHIRPTPPIVPTGRGYAHSPLFPVLIGNIHRNTRDASVSTRMITLYCTTSGYASRPFSTLRKGVSLCSLAAFSLMISSTCHPCTVRASAMSERWQRQGTASLDLFQAPAGNHFSLGWRQALIFPIVIKEKCHISTKCGTTSTHCTQHCKHKH